jgi:hypothetical protein
MFWGEYEIDLDSFSLDEALNAPIKVGQSLDAKSLKQQRSFNLKLLMAAINFHLKSMK